MARAFHKCFSAAGGRCEFVQIGAAEKRIGIGGRFTNIKVRVEYIPSLKPAKKQRKVKWKIIWSRVLQAVNICSGMEDRKQ